MLASTCPMQAPMHTVPTTSQRYEARRAMAGNGGGSRPLHTAARNAPIERGPGEAALAEGVRSSVTPESFHPTLPR